MVTSLKEIVEAMCRFQTRIDFSCSERVTVAACLALEPRLVYYIGHYKQAGGTQGHLEMTYENTDIPMKGIYRASDKMDVLHQMLRYAYNFKSCLIVSYDRRRFDASNLISEFSERYGAHLPMLRAIRCNNMQIGDVPHQAVVYTFEYQLGRVTLSMMEQEVDAQVEQLCRTLFLPGMPASAKILLAHNYLATHIQYVDNESDPLEKAYTHSAYGALIRKRCVCQGYAEAFNRMMNHEGIECRSIGGVASPVLFYSSDKEEHAWNVVAVGPASYIHVDATWDKNEKQADLTWFALTDAQMRAKGRQWTKTGVPPCHADGAAVLRQARDYIRLHRSQLLANGVDSKTLAGV